MPITVSDINNSIPIAAEVRDVATSNAAISLAGHAYDSVVAGLAARSTYSLKMQSIGGERGSVAARITVHVDDGLEGFGAFKADNWDGASAKAIDPATLDAAKALLAKLPFWVVAPEAAPASDGSIGLEWIWQQGGRFVKVFIDIGPGRRVTTYIRDSKGQTSEAIKTLDDLDIMNHVQGLFVRAVGPFAEAA